MMLDDPRWFKDAVIYELHVRSFYDSVGDGMGDFSGLTQKLDYLQDLGVTAIWLLPFYPSPLKDDGYDIADYQNIHPQYGTLDSFREFLEAAHQRGLKVITELVLNHTSDQHPWFQRARRSPPGSVERDFYVWSDTADRYAGVPIVFKDYESSNWAYDNVARAYYWHRFYSHQPDLNFDNPAVKQAIFPIVDFWFELGVDGMRLDAVPYLFEREGTTCAGLPETHQFLRELRAHVDAKFPNRMFLAEANVWPEEAVRYFGDGDECQMAFHFPVMPRLYMAMFREDRFPIVDIMQQTPAIPDSCQWALFLRNHDELTLEMVTDEERDSMYRAYARDAQARINVGIRRRLAPLLSNNRRRIELMNGLLFSLPGTPVIYYGDEIGMGDNIFLGDRNSVRTPMQWSADRNAGFSRANPQKLFLPVTIDPEYHYEAFNVDAQQNNSQSLLWWMKRLIDIRKRTPAFSRGSLAFLHPANRKVLAFLRHHEEQTVLVLANLSRFVQYAQLDLSAFEGYIPVELFGGTRFPTIGKTPYFVMLGPHTFCWFELCASVPERVCPLPARRLDDVATLSVRKSWVEVATRDDDAWERLLTQFLECRLLSGAAPSAISRVAVRDWLLLPATSPSVETLLLFIDVHRLTGEPQRIVLPLTFADDSRTLDVLANQPGSVLARIDGGQTGLLFDPLADLNYAAGVLNLLATSPRLRSHLGHDCNAWLNSPLTEAEQSAVSAVPRLIEIEQYNVSAVFDDRLVLKLLTHVAEGPHPDAEIGQFLSRCSQPCSVAKFRGAIELRGRRQPPMTLAVLHEYVVNEGDAWQDTLDGLSTFFEQVLTRDALSAPPPSSDWRQGLASPEVAPNLAVVSDDLLAETLDMTRLLARRTAELHVALASDPSDPNFAPEPFTLGYQRSIYQAMRGLALDVLDTLLQSLDRLQDASRTAAESLLTQRSDLLHVMQRLLDEPLNTVRIRTHGDYHLGQVLLTGSDCVIIDFEGKPYLPLTERRIKRSPLRDVATMLRSLDYASRVALTGSASGRGRMPGQVRLEDLPRLTPWVQFWQAQVSGEFLKSYLAHPGLARLLPKTTRGVRVLLDAFLMERCLVDLAHELHDRPDWLPIALDSALAQIASASSISQNQGAES